VHRDERREARHEDEVDRASRTAGHEADRGLGSGSAHDLIGAEVATKQIDDGRVVVVNHDRWRRWRGRQLPAVATEGSVRRGRGRPRHDTPSADYIARKELILQKAAEVFAAKGYEAGTLDDVAAALDMRKAGRVPL